MRRWFSPVLACVVLAANGVARAETTFTAHRSQFTDEKAVFATVESPKEIPARARIGGSVASLAVRQGDSVAEGHIIAVIGDDKLTLQIASLDAQITGLEAQLAQTRVDLTRAETLFRQGSGPKTVLDQAHTAEDVATSTLRARIAERQVLLQNVKEGQVLAPAAGRVLTVLVTPGSVVLNGDPVATIGQLPFMLRLRIPERHAVFLKPGDPVRVDTTEPGAGNGAVGTIDLIYPRIEEGRVVADARVGGLGDYFVGDRIRVWIDAGTRTGFVVPAAYVLTRSGLDYVLLRQDGGRQIETMVQRGDVRAGTDDVEILSGVADGDVLVRP
jgi:RND family efflux transporter MFP subunit